MEIRYILFPVVMACLSGMMACSGVQERQFDEVRQRAGAAAAEVVAADSCDNMMQLQDCILAAKAVQSEYLLLGDTAAADTFDVVFRHCVERSNGSLASELFNATTAHKR